jgi:hypothetical protein
MTEPGPTRSDDLSGREQAGSLAQLGSLAEQFHSSQEGELVMKQHLSLRSLAMLIPLVVLLDLVLRWPRNRLASLRTGKRTAPALLAHPLGYLSDWMSRFALEAAS